jgi:uncharacterized protein DUF5658
VKMSHRAANVCVAATICAGATIAMSRNACAQDGPGVPADVAVAVTRDRPVFLPLYGSFIGLQALDFHSTVGAIKAGGREANPVMNSMMGGIGLPIVKVAGTGAIIYLTERVRKHNRRAAIVTMIALDSAYATIVAHNYAIAHR